MVKQTKPSGSPFIARYGILLLALIPLVVYLPALRLGFVYFDDDILILRNFDKLTDLSNIAQFFRTDAFLNGQSPYFRPLQTVTFMIEALAGGRSPVIYHAVNILLHILTCFGLFGLLKRTGVRLEVAWAAALLFSIHPLAGHAVLWIPARGDLLLALFAVWSFSWFLRYMEEGRKRMLTGHALALAAALLSKESGILLPFLMAGYFLATRRKTAGKRWLMTGLVWLVVVLSWFLLRYFAIEHRTDNQIGLHAMGKNLPFIPEIVTWFFFPVNMPVTPVFTRWVTLAGVLLIFGLVILIHVWRKSAVWPVLLLGAAWFAGFCLPNMYVRLTGANDSFEYLMHRAYLPSVGLILVLASLAGEGWFRSFPKRVKYAGTALLVLLSSLTILLQNRYLDAKSFWGSAIEYRPDKAWFRYYMGRYYFKMNDPATYERYLLEADSLHPYAEFSYQLAMVNFADRKNYEASYRYFRQALDKGFSDPAARQNYLSMLLEWAAHYYSKGEYQRAVERCEEAIALNPDHADAYYNLGIYRVNAGDKAGAASAWRRAITLDPGLARAYRSLSLYYQHDVKKADSSAWYAREYELRRSR